MDEVTYAQLSPAPVACPVCLSEKFETIARVDRYGMGVPTCQCRDCGLVMTNPMPSEAALGTFYRDSYRQFYRKVEAPSEEHIAEYGLAVRAADTARFLAKAGLIGGSSGAVLDVGCAEGSLLRAIRAVSPTLTLHGVEPNPHFGAFAERAAGAEVVRSLDERVSSGRRFSLITVNHVLEHVRDPVAFLGQLRDLLSEEGSLYVDVPDAARYRTLDDLHIAHLYHFTVASLQNVAFRAGLQVTCVEKHSPVRHPLSVRAVLRPSVAPMLRIEDPERTVARACVRRIAVLAPLIRLRRSPMGRALLDRPLSTVRRIVGG